MSKTGMDDTKKLHEDYERLYKEIVAYKSDIAKPLGELLEVERELTKREG